MRRPCVVFLFILVLALGNGGSQRATAQNVPGNSLLEPAKKIELGSLKVSLRLEDQTPFLGAAHVRVFPEEGYDLLGWSDAATGNVMFYAVKAGRYQIEVNAPGFGLVRMDTELQSADEKTVIVLVKRGSFKAKEVSSTTDVSVATVPSVPPLANRDLKSEPPAETAQPPLKAWKHADWDDDGLPLDQNVACPLDQLLRGAGERVKEFVGSMEKFTATERVEHYAIDKSGERRKAETRRFDYVAIVARDRTGGFWFEEYRNGTTDTQQFPANIATMGLPAIVLVFHPDFQDDFEFGCDGLVHEQARDLWRLHWAQREHHPVRIESYVVNGMSFPVHLEGRAWIDTGRGQVVRLESNLERPVPEIELWEQHQIIDYTGVRFASTGEEIWLPQDAEVYVERHGKKYDRRHSFSDFRLFNVDTAQNVGGPKGSYRFTNLTDSDMTGELTVTPITGITGGPITLRFEVPAHRTVIKTVGLGKDVSLKPADIGSAKFVHSGNAGSVKVDVDLVKETTLDVIPAGAQENP